MTLENEILSIYDYMQKILRLLYQQQDVDLKSKEDTQEYMGNFSAGLSKLVQASQKLEAYNHDLRNRIYSLEYRYTTLEEAMGSLVRRLIYEFD